MGMLRFVIVENVDLNAPKTRQTSQKVRLNALIIQTNF